MNKNNFTELYQTLTTDRLLDIVDNPSDYQSLAVEAARHELDNRQLTAEQLETAKTIQADRQKAKADKQQQMKVIEDKIKSFGSLIADILNPIQNEASTTDKHIKLISLFLVGLFLYQLYREVGMLQFMFTDSSAEWDFSMVLYFLPLFVLSTSGTLMWLRKKHGWTLATLFFSYTAAGAVLLFLSALNRQLTGNTALDTIFPVVSPMIYVGTFLLFGGMTWVMTKQNIREVYNIDKRTMLITIGLGAVTVLLITM
ncbi:MAG: hypothetical protein KIT62_07995 [Cyclobacteriaceae bacterium]|nr:hypothetical protein [Cyclobacteriaceae bacterium]